MIVQVDVAVLQGWITIGVTSFGMICGATVAGIRMTTKPMVKALNDLNTTVKEINADHIKTKERVSEIEMTHRMRGCDQPIKEGA